MKLAGPSRRLLGLEYSVVGLNELFDSGLSQSVMMKKMDVISFAEKNNILTFEELGAKTDEWTQGWDRADKKKIWKKMNLTKLQGVSESPERKVSSENAQSIDEKEENVTDSQKSQNSNLPYDESFRTKLQQAKEEVERHDIRIEALEREIKNLEKIGGNTKRARQKLSSSKELLSELKVNESVRGLRVMLADPDDAWRDVGIFFRSFCTV